MKCIKCGKEIANDSNFCEYCGAKVIVAKAKKQGWILFTVNLSLCVIGGYLLYDSIIPNTGIMTDAQQIPNTGIMTDAQQMNIHGSIKKITEKSYYTYTTEYEEMKDQRIERGKLFDDCRFMSLVYGNEHLARLNYRNFLLQQVSDCDMFFNKDGNLTELTSLNPDGGFVRFHYEGFYNEIPLLKKMNIGEYSHVEEEVIDFQYEKEGDNLVREIQQRRGYSWGDTISDTINYLYESNRLVRAESNDYYVIYLRNGRIGTIRWPKFRNGRDLIIKIRYDESNYIVSVDWNEGSYKKAHIEFTYKLDRRGNWFERNAIVTYEYEYESKLMPAIIRTVREYEYY